MPSNKKKPDPQKSFELFLQRHRKGVFDSLRIWSKNHHLAEDLCQETFARAFEDIRKHGSPDRPKFYLKRIAKNLWIDHRRARRGKENLNSNPQEWVCERSEGEYGNSPLFSKNLSELDGVFSKLPTEEQDFLKHFYLEGRSCWEIAILNGLSVGSARMRVHRARKKLQDEFSRNPIHSWTCSPRDLQTQTIQKGMTNDSFSDSENRAVLVG